MPGSTGIRALQQAADSDCTLLRSAVDTPARVAAPIRVEESEAECRIHHACVNRRRILRIGFKALDDAGDSASLPAFAAVAADKKPCGGSRIKYGWIHGAHGERADAHVAHSVTEKRPGIAAVKALEYACANAIE